MPNHIHYQQYLEQLFGAMTAEQVQQVFAVTEILHFEYGQYLFHEGDNDNSLYIVLSGRLRVLKCLDNHFKILGDIAMAEPVGELALFTKEPRSASVVAIRRSTVLKIDEESYMSLVVQYPHFANRLTQFVISRLRRSAFQEKMAAPPKNIALINLQPDNDLTPWTEEIRTELTSMGVDIAVYYPDDVEKENPQAVFDEIENSDGMNILVCDAQHIGWGNQCLTYSDLVLVVSDFYAPHGLYPIEEQLLLYTTDILNKKVYLILLHPENALMPRRTNRWLEERNLNLHLHLRKNNSRDIRRFSRILTNRAVGLVLGGGGAKGFAHIGAARAMMQAGIEFDFVGGTSAGALMGACMTITDFDEPHLDRVCVMGVNRKVTTNDYNFPFLSLMTGQKMRRFLLDVFEDTHLEDLWVTTFCLSTNYSKATAKIHENGLIRKQIEASIAIPGIFPPVIIDSQLHVDGGVMDNLPIEAMYQKTVRHVIAISLSPQSTHVVELENIPSAWEIFINKITKKRRLRLPAMPSLLINSLTLNSKQKQESSKSQVAIYLEMDLRKFGLLEWSKWEQLIKKGYSEAEQYLKSMPENEQFWK